ncbi:MAG: polyphosphate kinase 2 family protein [Flavobacterium sp.]|nr:MAG: polyphosphate kinase 2 family protein [Flavobacterium sp.]
MKAINTADFKVTSTFDIKTTPTKIDLGASEDRIKEALKDTGKELSSLQDKMYANNRYGMLICLQGMDTSGKDSLVREVFKRFNVRGVVVHSFKTPTSAELEHDYLWRHYIALPEKGKFAVFNRSHYENVLVSRVHPEYLLNENLPGINEVEDVPEDFWQQRFTQINNFEQHLAQNGTIVLKFFLNLSKGEQKERLLRRLENPKHNWKFAPGDLEERALWDKYQEYYQDAINNTSKPHAPWYVIPADDKATARYIVAQAILDELSKYKDIKEPELDDEIKAHISKYREALNSE